MVDFARRRMPAMLCLPLVHGRLVETEGPLCFPDGTGAEEYDEDDEPPTASTNPTAATRPSSSFARGRHKESVPLDRRVRGRLRRVHV